MYDHDELSRELDKTFRLIDERAELVNEYWREYRRWSAIIGQLPPLEFTDYDRELLKSLRIKAE